MEITMKKWWELHILICVDFILLGWHPTIHLSGLLTLKTVVGLYFKNKYAGIMKYIIYIYKDFSGSPSLYRHNPCNGVEGGGVGCLLWVEILIYVLHLLLECFMEYHVILDHVIMALNYIGFAPFFPSVFLYLIFVTTGPICVIQKNIFKLWGHWCALAW